MIGDAGKGSTVLLTRDILLAPTVHVIYTHFLEGGARSFPPCITSSLLNPFIFIFAQNSKVRLSLLELAQNHH
jgi:hypothetical protein